MGKWLMFLCAALLSTICLANDKGVEALSFEIDSVATANSPWKMGEKVDEFRCYYTSSERGLCYTIFLGVTVNNNIVLQRFFPSGKKLSNPYTLIPNITDFKHNHKNMDGAYIEWYENGQQAAERYFEKGKNTGHWIQWYKSGQINYEYYIADSKGISRSIWWYPNGNKSQEYYYLNNGERHGSFLLYHENGQKRYGGLYQNGKQVGIWRNWDEQGNLIEEKDYDNPK